MALEAQSVFWIVFFAIMLANIAHDMVVCVQQPMFTELFGASYRYSGAGVGYRGERRGRRIYAIYCRRAGNVLRRKLAQRGRLPAGRLPAVGRHGAGDEETHHP